MYKDGRFANLQRRRDCTTRVQETESGYGDTSREGNEIGVLEPTRSGEHVAISCELVPNLPCTRTQFRVIELVPSRTRSQPGLARHARTYLDIIKYVWGSPQL